MSELLIVHNPGPLALVVWIEPWCDEITVPVGSTLCLTSHDMRPGQSTTIERTDEGLTIWPEGGTYSAEIDGKEHLV